MATRRTKKQAAAGEASPVGITDPLVIYIHGIGEHPPQERLHRQWDLALFGREMGEQSRMCYWVDLRHGAAGPAVKAAKSRRGTQPSTSNTDQAELFKAQFMARFDQVTSAPGVPRKKVLPLPGFLRKPISRFFLETLAQDAAAYFFQVGFRQEVQRRLRQLLPPPGQPFVLVAHSQGTVAALETLAALQKPLNLLRFVTIGSPLGLQEVQDHLECPLVVPASVERWCNFADRLDPVALDNALRSDFQPEELIQDEVIANTQSNSLTTFNPHSAVGYLAHPKVRSVVHRAIQFDSMAPFVVARDVAEAMAFDGVRHSVLIEILEPEYPALGEDRAHTRTIEKKEAGSTGRVTLEGRIQSAVAAIERIVGPRHDEAARIEPLQRFVAARLLPSEIQQVAAQHQELRVYAVWKSAPKRKLIDRSGRVLQADAALPAYSATGKGITWAILDTGVNHHHPHFLKHDSIKAVYDCTKRGPVRQLDPKGPNPDGDGHGSHVSGIVAGEGEVGGHLYRGMAPMTKLVVYKVLDDKGEGEDAWIIKALDHIAGQNANSAGMMVHGLNLSLGGPYDSTVYGCGFSPVCQELRRLWRSGMLVVTAAGNEGQLDVQTADGEVEINTPMSIGDPANLEDCISVGSVNTDRPHLYGISAFSSRGPTSDGRCKPDVVAPGERISSCNAHFNRDPNKKGKLYYQDSGTSMAAPHISGLLAAFLSARREFRGRPDEVKRLLLDSCTDLGRDRYHQGRGLPNLMKMLLSV